MPNIDRSALVNYSASQMYDLVNDVDSYCEFLPGCTDSKVIEQTDDMMIGLMELRKGPIAQTFTTRNTFVKDQSISLALEEGPFDFLKGKWTFKPLNEVACKVELKLKFKFSNRIAAVAFNGMFILLTSKLVDSFVSRAVVVYGKDN